MRLSMAMTLSMNGSFHVQARIGDDAHRLAEPHHQRLLRLVDA